MPPESAPDRLGDSTRRPDELLADFLGLRARGRGIRFDHWVRQHPVQEEELRRLWSAWTGFGMRPAEPPSSGGPPAEAGNGQDRTPGAYPPVPARETPPPGALESAEAKPGCRIGGYRLERLIGRGGMADVWEAEEVEGGRRVALKLIHAARITRRSLHYFELEGRTARRLDHPGIVAVLSVGQEGDFRYIVQELIEGGNTLRSRLEEIVRQPELPAGHFKRVARWFADLADALGAAHEQGVIHRDVKPGNIMITADSRAKVTDFGLARITDELSISHLGDIVGTCYYMSPEQVAARGRDIDPRSDVFGLGATLYEALTLRRPFDGRRFHEVCRRILEERPTDPRWVRTDLPYDLSAICLKALEKAQDQRFDSMADFAAALRGHLGIGSR